MSELEQVLKALEKYDGKYKRDEVTWADEHQAEITPHLIQIMQNLLDPEFQKSLAPDYHAHIYAFRKYNFKR